MIKISLCSLGSRLFFTRELDDEDCGNVQWGDSDNFVDDIDECKYVAKQIGDSFRNVSNDIMYLKVVSEWLLVSISIDIQEDNTGHTRLNFVRKVSIIQLHIVKIIY